MNLSHLFLAISALVNCSNLVPAEGNPTEVAVFEAVQPRPPADTLLDVWNDKRRPWSNGLTAKILGQTIAVATAGLIWTLIPAADSEGWTYIPEEIGKQIGLLSVLAIVPEFICTSMFVNWVSLLYRSLRL